jgi:hypothetical protein
MKKNKFLFKILPVAAVIILQACTGNFDEINRNPYEVTGDEMDRGGYATGAALRSLQGFVVPTQVNLHQFVEGLSGSEYGGYIASINLWGEGSFATYNPPHNWNRAPFDDIMAGVYPQYLPLSATTRNPVILSLAKLYRVAAMHRVTDAYGPIPYSKVGTGENQNSLTAPYDSQEDVYKQMLEELDEVIEVLTENRNVDAAAYANFDNVYAGRMESWVKFANSLKLRMAIRMSYVEPALAKQKAEEAVSHSIGVITSNTDNAFIRVTLNPWDLQINDWADSRIGADIISFMNGYGDPRRAAYFTTSTFPGGGYVGMRGGAVATAKEPLLPCSRMIVEVTSPMLWMNAAEVAFLKAEGALRGWSMGDTPENLYNRGIDLSFEQHGVSGAMAYKQDDSSTPSGYTYPLGNASFNFNAGSTITIKWDEAASLEQKLERIITQKWIAIFPLGNEAWAEFRRTGYPKLAPVVVNNSGGAIPVGSFVKRLVFSSTEYMENAENIFTAIGLLNGPDNMGTKLWWDKKN